MTGGPLSFEAFKINDMNAAVAFGAIDGDPFKAENYLAASADLTIGEYGMAGGVFFGRSCSLDPIALIDPEVAGVLGAPPFTGAYLYGEARLPINELIGIPSTCMLNVVVGARPFASFRSADECLWSASKRALILPVRCVSRARGPSKAKSVPVRSA